MNAIEWVMQCHEIENDLENLVQLLGAMESEGAQREQEGFEVMCTGFISVAKRNMQAEKDGLSEAITQKQPEDIFYSLCSIQGTFRYFSDEDLSWSALWNEAALYYSILDKIIILLQHEKIGTHKKEFEEGLLAYNKIEVNN
ncbi:hypothetical protein [Spirobacillus cienkowskii]|uniref:hypothetical protein n=1 Tax=Spirobacillus cienkowskii TaxID=495820 RepID=UPI0030CA7960